MKFLAGALLALAALPSTLGFGEAPPNGQQPLGIAKDVASTGGVPGASAGNTYTAKIEFENDVYTSVLDGATQADKDAQLAGLARNAYWEMKERPDFPGGSKTAWSQRRPYVMTALAVGKTIYFGSSMRGGHFLYAGKDRNNPVWQGLVECQLAFIEAKKFTVEDRESRHKNNAACGEAMTMYAYHQDENAAGRQGNLRGAVAVTVRVPESKTKEVLPWGEIEVFDPCGTDMIGVTEQDKLKHFGCAQLTDQMGVRAITAPRFADFRLPDRIQRTGVHLDCTPFQGVAPAAN